MSVKSLGKAMAKKLGEAGYVKAALTAGVLGHSYAQARNEGQSNIGSYWCGRKTSWLQSCIRLFMYLVGLAIGAPKAGVQFYETFLKAKRKERGSSLCNTLLIRNKLTRCSSSVAMLRKQIMSNHTSNSTIPASKKGGVNGSSPPRKYSKCSR